MSYDVFMRHFGSGCLVGSERGYYSVIEIESILGGWLVLSMTPELGDRRASCLLELAEAIPGAKYW